MRDRETRALRGVELRVADNGTPSRIEGYAARYDIETDIAGFIEVIRPGAFQRAVDEAQDVRCLVDHDASRILGRTRAGTLRLEDRDAGLFMSCDVPETTVGKDVRISVERGDLDAMSFAFLPTRTTGERITRRDDGREVRELLDVDLFDVSVVTYPAYAKADFALALRSIERHREHEQSKLRREITLAEVQVAEADLRRQPLSIAPELEELAAEAAMLGR